MSEQLPLADPAPSEAGIRPAESYQDPEDLCVILCLFHIEADREKAANFERCRSVYQRSGIPLITIECAFGDAARSVPPGNGVFFVRAESLLWQKERLINLALPLVPRHCTKIAWVDADILFESAHWAVRASECLNDAVVVQLADHIVRLPRGTDRYTGNGAVWEGFASVYAREPNALLLGDFGAHGHSGFAWAARREVLEAAGLYDACVTGGADHVMAHAFCGDWDSPCLSHMLGERSAWRSHAAAWAARIYPLVKARVGFVEGAALHLWHGEIASRGHVQRYRPLWRSGFDPERDLQLDGNGCWRWASTKPAMHAEVGAYLDGRRREARALVRQCRSN